MKSQQRTSLVLLANNVSALSSSENKITPLFLSSVPALIITAITINSYGVALVSTQRAYDFKVLRA
jgi:hypothetical protein